MQFKFEWESEDFCFVSLSDTIIPSMIQQLDELGRGKETSCYFESGLDRLQLSVEQDQFYVNASRNLIDIHADLRVLLHISGSLKSHWFYKNQDGEHMLDISLESNGAVFIPSKIKEIVLGTEGQPR